MEIYCNSNVISPKILSSSKNCFINAPCCAALHAHIVSASLLESATSGLCPDLEHAQPCPLRKEKKYLPVLLDLDESIHIISMRRIAIAEENEFYSTFHVRIAVKI